MSIVEVRTLVDAPIELCFDLARDIDLHRVSTEGTDERAVAGVTSGLIGPGEEVTWEATHFGFRQRLTSRITAFDPPRRFRDSQVSGAFRRFDHDHIFAAAASGGTTMCDVFDFESPFGWLGRCADACFLRAYMRRFLERRALAIKAAAEFRARLSPGRKEF
jgi:ligand-binding SRPBCC domain-containing protein